MDPHPQYSAKEYPNQQPGAGDDNPSSSPNILTAVQVAALEEFIRNQKPKGPTLPDTIHHQGGDYMSASRDRKYTDDVYRELLDNAVGNTRGNVQENTVNAGPQHAQTQQSSIQQPVLEQYVPQEDVQQNVPKKKVKRQNGRKPYEGQAQFQEQGATARSKRRRKQREQQRRAAKNPTGPTNASPVVQESARGHHDHHSPVPAPYGQGKSQQSYHCHTLPAILDSALQYEYNQQGTLNGRDPNSTG